MNKLFPIVLALLFFSCDEDPVASAEETTFEGDWNVSLIKESAYDGQNCINPIESVLPENIYYDLGGQPTTIISSLKISLSSNNMINNINAVWSDLGQEDYCEILPSELAYWSNGLCQSNFFITYNVISASSNQICVKNTCSTSDDSNICFDYILSNDGNQLTLSYIRQDEYCYYDEQIHVTPVDYLVPDLVEKFAECMTEDSSVCDDDSIQGLPFCFELELNRDE